VSRSGLAARVYVAVTVVAFTWSTAGCDSGRGNANGAPPVSVCGDVLSTSAAGLLALDTAHVARMTVRGTTIDDNVWLQLSAGCAVGQHWSVSPVGAATLASEVVGKDGQPVAIGLHPHRASFDVIIDRAAPDPLPTTLVRVRLG
jgi:hypothetical protein